MAVMLRGTVHVLAWTLATGAAVTLSWWGVHSVMAGTAYDPPRAVPVRGVDDDPVSSSTRRPEPEPTPSSAPSVSAPARSPQPPRAPRGSAGRTAPDAEPSHSPSATAPTRSAGTVKTYYTKGGRVVFELRADSAALVSATPAPNWSMQVWPEDQWIRVEFSSGTDRVSVFCTWNGHPPQVEIATY